MARDAGAKKVYLASAAPPVRYPNIYGIDMPTPEELIAHGRSEAEIERMIGCDWLIYQDLAADLEAAVAGPSSRAASSTVPASAANTSPASTRAISSASASCAPTTPSTSADWRCDAFPPLPNEKGGWRPL